jgi:hypothetical protein
MRRSAGKLPLPPPLAIRLRQSLTELRELRSYRGAGLRAGAVCFWTTTRNLRFAN